MLRYIKAIFGVYDHTWTNHPMNASFAPRVKHELGGDFHIGSDYCDNPRIMGVMLERIAKWTYEDVVKARSYLNGDIVDLKCCHPDMVDTLIRLNEGLHRLYKDHYQDDGNHGAIRFFDEHWKLWFTIIKSPSGKVYAMTHGDRLIDKLREGTKKANYWRDYRNRENGIKGFKKFKVKVLDTMDFVKAKRPLPERYIELCTAVAKTLGVDGVIVSHFHVEDQRWYRDEGKEHVFLPAHRFTDVYL